MGIELESKLGVDVKLKLGFAASKMISLNAFLSISRRDVLRRRFQSSCLVVSTFQSDFAQQPKPDGNSIPISILTKPQSQFSMSNLGN